MHTEAQARFGEEWAEAEAAEGLVSESTESERVR